VGPGAGRQGAAKAAELAGKLADVAVETAKTLAAQAAQAAAAAAQYQAEAGALTRAWAKQLARKVIKVARAIGRVIKKAAKKIGRAAVAVGKAAYKYSGAQDVVSCVTNPTLAGCVKAAITVALTVGTAGEGEVAEIGLNAAEHAGENIAEGAGGEAVRDFAHGTSLENAQHIMSNGLDEAAARAASTGGRYAQRGAFFSFEVSPSAQEGVQLAYEMGLKRGTSQCVVLICRLPASTVSQLEKEGLVRTGSIPGVDLPETVFSPAAFSRINRVAEWKLLKP
jgi:hypothetical protein